MVKAEEEALYLDVLEKEKLYLLFAYSKNVQENLTLGQCKLLRRMAEAIMEEWIWTIMFSNQNTVWKK